MTNQEIIERLKPITNRQWWCDKCNRFLEADEAKQGSYQSNYCTHHASDDLSYGERARHYVEIVDKLVEDLSYEEVDE